MEKARLRGLVRDLAPNWNPDIQAAVSIARLYVLTSLVEELNVARDGGGIAVIHSASPDKTGYVWNHVLARVLPKGELVVDNHNDVQYSAVPYEADFSGKVNDGLQLHMLRDRNGGWAERVFDDLYACNTNTRTGEFSGERRAVSIYDASGPKVSLKMTAFDFEYTSGALAKCLGEPPTRSAINLDYVGFYLGDGDKDEIELVRYHYNGKGSSDIVWPRQDKTPYQIEGSMLHILTDFSVDGGGLIAEVKEGREADDLRWPTRVKSPLCGNLPVANWGETTNRYDVPFLDNLASSVLSLVPRSLPTR